jgi:hypothetical protein
MKILPTLFLAMLVATSCSVDRHGVIGANFRLRKESPLPSWLTLPEDVDPKTVRIKINRYEATAGKKWKVRVIVHTDAGRTLADKIGYSYWHSQSEKEARPAGTFPNWTIFEIEGTKDVYEQSEFNDLLKIVDKPLK